MTPRTRIATFRSKLPRSRRKNAFPTNPALCHFLYCALEGPRTNGHLRARTKPRAQKHPHRSAPSSTRTATWLAQHPGKGVRTHQTRSPPKIEGGNSDRYSTPESRHGSVNSESTQSETMCPKRSCRQLLTPARRALPSNRPCHSHMQPISKRNRPNRANLLCGGDRHSPRPAALTARALRLAGQAETALCCPAPNDAEASCTRIL